MSVDCIVALSLDQGAFDLLYSTAYKLEISKYLYLPELRSYEIYSVYEEGVVGVSTSLCVQVNVNLRNELY